jgi:hypothetical protein
MMVVKPDLGGFLFLFLVHFLLCVVMPPRFGEKCDVELNNTVARFFQSQSWHLPRSSGETSQDFSLTSLV